jgi:hypothetical protein
LRGANNDRSAIALKATTRDELNHCATPWTRLAIRSATAARNEQTGVNHANRGARRRWGSAIAPSCMVTLNPLLKLDGYWVLADLIGVTNLSAQPGRLVARLWRRLRGDAVAPLPWSLPVAGVLLGYSILSARASGAPSSRSGSRPRG